jgi:hypothetical protein
MVDLFFILGGCPDHNDTGRLLAAEEFKIDGKAVPNHCKRDSHNNQDRRKSQSFSYQHDHHGFGDIQKPHHDPEFLSTLRRTFKAPAFFISVFLMSFPVVFFSDDETEGDGSQKKCFS